MRQGLTQDCKDQHGSIALRTALNVMGKPAFTINTASLPISPATQLPTYVQQKTMRSHVCSCTSGVHLSTRHTTPSAVSGPSTRWVYSRTWPQLPALTEIPALTGVDRPLLPVLIDFWPRWLLLLTGTGRQWRVALTLAHSGVDRHVSPSTLDPAGVDRHVAHQPRPGRL